ncbi:MAG: cation:proton antiporter [Caldimicrobium sp.]|nr:cation:proton antiporter [Caldimicrobium sp.]MCX7872985.1 cation:proton antiporter [Caldimicrobium sp.]
MLQEFLTTLLWAFLIALPLTFLFVKLKLPPLVSFLLTGLIVGPAGFSLVKDPHLVEGLAELGVIFLMFLLGVEFSVKKLLGYRREVLWGGLMQVIITTLFVALLTLLFFHYKIGQAVFYGTLVAFSSTAVVLKLLIERGELNTPYGRYIFGILLFQDLSVIIVMLLLPLLGGEGISLRDILQTLLKSLSIFLLVFGISLKVVPLLLYSIVKTRSRELFLISIFIIALGTAFFSYKLGLSMALGAFLAGLVVSESEIAYQTMAELKPLKELFMALFFISIGMLLNPDILIQNPGATLLSFITIFVVKVIGILMVVLLLSKSFRVSLISALYLFQIGEFSFVLALEGSKYNLFSERAYQIFLSASILTLMFTPFVVSWAHRFSDFFLARVFPRKFRYILRKREREVESSSSAHTIVVGFGVCGKNVVYGLKILNIPYIILELNPTTVKIYRQKGEPIYFADATHPEILLKFGIQRAKALVIAVGDNLTTRKIIHIARSLNPFIYIIARTQFIAEIEELLKLGADEVVPEEFETSIELFAKVLEFYRVPKNVINDLLEEIRSGHYEALRAEGKKITTIQSPSEWWRLINFQTYLVKRDSLLNGLTLRGLDLRAKTGASLVAIQRGEELIQNPSPDISFKEGDLLILIGGERELRKAIKYLENPLEAWY